MGCEQGLKEALVLFVICKIQKKSVFLSKIKNCNMNIASSKTAAAFNDLELKGYLHSLIERAKDRKQLLLFAKAVESFFNENTLMDYEKEVENWDELSFSQQNTLKIAIEESNHPQNLIPHDEVLKMMDAWIAK
jgi:hypothetical protein